LEKKEIEVMLLGLQCDPPLASSRVIWEHDDGAGVEEEELARLL